MRRWPSSRHSLRDRVLITVLYSAGLRLGEVCRLAVADIDSARMLLHIRQAKGHKDRYAPLSPIALELLREWWRQTMRGTRRSIYAEKAAGCVGCKRKLAGA